MLRYLFYRLWKNPFARYGTLAALVLIIFAGIFSARFRIAMFWHRLFSSPDWSDAIRHAGRPFAFEENPRRAQELTEEAWRELYRLAVETFGIQDKEKDIFIGPVGTKPYSAFLRRSAEEQVFTLLNATAQNCSAVQISVVPADTTQPLGELAERSTPAGKIRPKLRETLLALLQIYRNRIEAALEKKPDYLPALELAGEIFRAACALRDLAVLYARALDYREYALQKQLYLKDAGLYEKNPEEFYAQVHELYRNDREYHALLMRYFIATRHRTPHHPAQLKNLRETYYKLRTAASAQALIAALLAEARHSSVGNARKCHYELFALDYPGLSENPQYLYALAETAYLGEEFVRAQNIVSNALRTLQSRRRAHFQEDETVRALERLSFLLQLRLYESENLSRF
ncbi:MAG: hypothetical protein N2Z22_00655 [Turneriella sp.]|nr:hypothetical protein [Turneriella sp.]